MRKRMRWAVASSNYLQRIRKGSRTETFSLPQPWLAHTKARREFWTLPFLEFWPLLCFWTLFLSTKPSLGEQTSLIHMDATFHHVSAARNRHQEAVLPSSFPVGRSLALSEGAVILLMNNFLLMNKPWMSSLAENSLSPTSGPSPLLLSDECDVYTHTLVNSWFIYFCLEHIRLQCNQP